MMRLGLMIGIVFVMMSAVASDMPVIVESENVCMVSNVHFRQKQKPVKHAGKTYFVSCESCKTTIINEAKTRIAVDPVVGKTVDKAKAVIAAQTNNSVLYFESKKTFEEYNDAMESFKRPGPSGGRPHH